MYENQKIACAKNYYLSTYLALHRSKGCLVNVLGKTLTKAVACQRLAETRSVLVSLCGEEIMSQFVTWQPRNLKGRFQPLRARWKMQKEL